VEQELSEVSKVLDTTHLVVKLRVDWQVEVVINLCNLCEVLVLHLPTSLALAAVLGGVGEQDLVDYNVVDVDFLLGELDGETLSFVH